VETAEAWAEKEFRDVELNDERRTDRLVRVAVAIATRPAGTLAGSFSDPSELKASYRLFSATQATFESITAPHFARTEACCREPGEYLLIEDTTTLDFTSHKAAVGLGHVGDSRGQGILLHSTMALQIKGWGAEQEPQVSIEGLIAQKWWTRQHPPRKKTESWKARRNRSRESARWAECLLGQPPLPPGTRWTFVADREADVYEALVRCTQKNMDFNIRACQPRTLLDKQLSFDVVRAAPPLGVFNLKLRARPGQPARNRTNRSAICQRDAAPAVPAK
jgi:hypothetical protein